MNKTIIRQAMDQLDVTQEQLVEATGYSRDTIQRACTEFSDSPISAQKLIKIAQALQIPETTVLIAFGHLPAESEEDEQARYIAGVFKAADTNGRKLLMDVAQSIHKQNVTTALQ